MNLTSLADVRQWVGSSTTTDDALLNRLIAEASRTILNYLQRSDMGLDTITETISGRGERKAQLRNWPVIEVNSLTINGVSIPASTGSTIYGYFLEPVYGALAGRPQNLGIIGGVYLGSGIALSGSQVTFAPTDYRQGPFARGIGNISVNYSYGYCAQNEGQTIPAGSPYTITPASVYGSWSGDNGVSYASGVALTAIAAGTPSTGQYVPPNLSGDSPTLVYTFASADAGKSVLLNYNYIPYDIEQACIEVVGERYRYRSRIGQTSQSLGGQEVSSYLVKDGLTAAIEQRLDPYRMAWVG